MSGSGAQGGGTTMILMWVGIAGVMYFFMIRPQQKRAKDQASFKNDLKAGDRVVTVGGIHVKVVNAEPATLLVETDGGQRFRVERAAISPEYTKAVQSRETGAVKAA